MASRPNFLVAYLATPGGEDALALGGQLAECFDTDLRVCMVVPPVRSNDATAPLGDFVEIVDRQTTESLDEARAELPDDVAADAYVATYENTADGIASEARRLDSAAIVVGGSGGGILGRHSLGSVVNGLLHVATTPVVVAPRGMREVATPIRRVTCAVGSGPGNPALIRAAIRACVRADLELRLLSLVSLDDRETAASQLDELVAAVRPQLPDGHPVTAVLGAGHTVEDAVGSLEWDPGDFLFVGSSRLARPLHMFLGTTAAKMMRVLAVPVVVVPRDA
ncbi:universal stress protein [Gordonia sp. NPDC003425]